jgi:hypothetical protein
MLMAFGRSEYAFRDTPCGAFAEEILSHPRVDELIAARDSDGMTCLHYACHSVPICKMILDIGAEVNVQSSGGQTPLHLAAAFPRGEYVESIDICADVFEQLLEHGADPSLKDEDGCSPAEYLRETYGVRIEMRLRWAIVKRSQGPWLGMWMKQLGMVGLPTFVVGAVAARFAP